MRFKKGKSGNPNGRPPVPADIRTARALNQMELEKIINRCAFLSLPELKAVAKSKTLPAFECLIAKILEVAVKNGDHWRAEFVLQRMIGPVAKTEREVSPPPGLPEPMRKRTFSEYCVQAGYPAPFQRQIDMQQFGFFETLARILLGARGYGKTDYVTILGTGYSIYSDWFDNAAPTETNLIISKSKTRNTAMLGEIADSLKKNGVPLSKQNASCIRVQGLSHKDHSVEVLPLKASFRGRHPKRLLMDDPVTEEDTSEATRAMVKKKYDEAYKLCKNLIIIGQPAHALDLYAELRPILKKMEVPHGEIPELDADLEAMKFAGVDLNSIQMSYHLTIPKDASVPFGAIKYMDEFPTGDSVAFIDPSDGGDFTALSIFKGYMDGVAVVGSAWQRAWFLCMDEIVPILKARGVKKLCFETNCTGSQPIDQLRQILAPLGIGVVGVHSDTNKEAVIMAAASYCHMIHLSRRSNSAYTNQVTKYVAKAKYDDAPDSLARGLVWIGLIRGKK